MGILPTPPTPAPRDRPRAIRAPAVFFDHPTKKGGPVPKTPTRPTETTAGKSPAVRLTPTCTHPPPPLNPEIPTPTPPPAAMPLHKIDWATVPDSAFLAAQNTTLAARLGCSPQNVARERRARGLTPHPRGGNKTGTDPKKSPFPLTPRAARHLRAIARAAGVSPSAFLLTLQPAAGPDGSPPPTPAPAPAAPRRGPAQNHISGVGKTAKN